MRKSLVALSWMLLCSLSVGCEGEHDWSQEGDCDVFPDSCPAGMQCYPGTPDREQTVCLVEGLRGQEEACDAEADNIQNYCGRHLLCVAYGLQGLTKLCSPLCETDEDCRQAGLTSSCTVGAETGWKFCPVR